VDSFFSAADFNHHLCALPGNCKFQTGITKARMKGHHTAALAPFKAQMTLSLPVCNDFNFT